MNTQNTLPKPHQLQESTAGEEDPGAGLDAADSAIHPAGVAPISKAEQSGQTERPASPEKKVDQKR